MNVPSQRSWVTGEIVTAAELNTNVRDAVNYLIAPPYFIVRQATPQSIGSGSYVVTTWDAEDIDRDNGHSTVTNTGRYTANTAGYYMLQTTINWPTSGINTGASFWCGAVFQPNGASGSRFGRVSALSQTGANMCQHTGGRIFLNLTDYVEVLSINGTGGTGSLAAADGQPRFSGAWESS